MLLFIPGIVESSMLLQVQEFFYVLPGKLLEAFVAGVIPGELSAAVGTAQVDQLLVIANDAGKAGQDRSQGRQPRPICDLSNGRGVGIEVAVL